MSLRLKLSGTAITDYTDVSEADADVEFAINRPRDPFPDGWTVTGTAPSRHLVAPDGSLRAVEWVDASAQAPHSGGGTQPYVPGTDRLAVTTSLVMVTPGDLTTIDWSINNPYITVIGGAVTLVGGDITFLEDGLYHVQVHLPGDPLAGITAARLALSLINEAADGSDVGIVGGDATNKQNAGTAAYVWCHVAGDVVTAKITSDGTGDPVPVTTICQVVRLSLLAPGDEFVASDRLDSLPTSDPHVLGHIWLDTDTVRVSAG
jgi:hypothetical protein